MQSQRHQTHLLDSKYHGAIFSEITAAEVISVASQRAQKLLVDGLPFELSRRGSAVLLKGTGEGIAAKQSGITK
jgi:hypothetical protein